MNTHIFLLATLALLPACSFEGGIFDSNTAAKPAFINWNRTMRACNSNRNNCKNVINP